MPSREMFHTRTDISLVSINRENLKIISESKEFDGTKNR